MSRNILQESTGQLFDISQHEPVLFSVLGRMFDRPHKSNIPPIAVHGDPGTRRRFTLEQSGPRRARPAWTGGPRFTGNMTVKQQLSRPAGSPIKFHGKHDGETTAHTVGGGVE